MLIILNCPLDQCFWAYKSPGESIWEHLVLPFWNGTYTHQLSIVLDQSLYLFFTTFSLHKHFESACTSTQNYFYHIPCCILVISVLISLYSINCFLTETILLISLFLQYLSVSSCKWFKNSHLWRSIHHKFKYFSILLPFFPTRNISLLVNI